MGKKRKEEDRGEVDEVPPDFAPASENKKTKVAAFHKLSLETLREKEKEASRELNRLQNELVRQRAARVTAYGDNNLRNMNTKRHRAEFVLGEIKAEIERRKIKKSGNSIPDEGILAGSAAGQAATKWDHYYEGKALTAKQREEKALAEKKAAAEETQDQKVAKMQYEQKEWANMQHQSASRVAPTAIAANQTMSQDPWANAWAATAKAAAKAMSAPTMPHSFEQGEASFMMGGAVPSTASMMGMMGGRPDFAMLAQQNAGMSAAHMTGVTMHQVPTGMPAAFHMQNPMQSPPTGIPAAFANVKAFGQHEAVAASPESNIPAAFRNRL